MQASWEDVDSIRECPWCKTKPVMKIHKNSDWVNGPSCILEADGCYCINTNCDFVYGAGPWQEKERCWDAKVKTWRNQYGQLVQGTLREE